MVLLFITLSSAVQGAGKEAKAEAKKGHLYRSTHGFNSGGYPSQRSSIYTGGYNKIVKRSSEAAPAPAAAPTYRKVAPAPASTSTYRRAAPYFRRY
jgi:hypothetical protein